MGPIIMSDKKKIIFKTAVCDMNIHEYNYNCTQFPISSINYFLLLHYSKYYTWTKMIIKAQCLYINMIKLSWLTCILTKCK